MNFIFISPNFPHRNFKWAEALRAKGVKVLGIGDAPNFNLSKRLSLSLDGYRFVKDLSNIQEMVGVCQDYEREYGKIDFIESNNEWWLEEDALLREKLDVPNGFRPREMKKIKAKSEMKKCFALADVKTMRYILVKGKDDLEKAKEFAKEVGYPLFVKPDVGVGANHSFSLKNDDEVASFLNKDLPETYIMEEFIEGKIVSFDGISDDNSEVVFATSDHFSTPISNVVIGKEDYFYYNNPFELPFMEGDGPSFLSMGTKVIKAFGIRKRFFHIEFFLLSQDKEGLARRNEFVGLECNMRPPGGYTPDLINFANSLSCYDIYADVIATGHTKADLAKEKYYAFASSRRDSLSYEYEEEEIFRRYKGSLCAHGRYPESLALAMADSYYYARFKDFEEGLAFDKFVRQKK